VGVALVSRNKRVSSELVSWNFRKGDIKQQSSILAICFNQRARLSVPASLGFTRSNGSNEV
jgi:hypothetical protein